MKVVNGRGMNKSLTIAICTVLLSVLSTACASHLFDNGNDMDGDKLFGDKNLFEDYMTVSVDTVAIGASGSKYILLQDILKGLGAQIIWDEESTYAYFEFKETEYVCKFVLPSQMLDGLKIENILISKNEYIHSLDNKDHIQLNPMSANGAAVLIDKEIYLSPDSARRLFEALGCTVEFNQDRTAMTVSY